MPLLLQDSHSDGAQVWFRVLEMNVTVKEMVNLIEVQRAYEANQKVIQAFDETLGKLINEVKV